MLQFVPTLTPPTLPNFRLSSKALPFGANRPKSNNNVDGLPVFHM